ncbi:MBL fold metallo-hydrolase [Bacillus sp. JCM 19041]|uniref:MBL fold metallo-hydrolase n=1 Tax=Bacillus sp. JCM 19041 TaxID=1460637 RepID=UPI0006D19650
MLTFIGCGSAFHTELGNNGAFFKADNELCMIDCGSATFHRLIDYQVLNRVNQITVLMTHLHPDHIGSLGDLIFYSYFKMAPTFEAKLTVLAPEDVLVEAKSLMKKMGVEDQQVNWLEIGEVGIFGPYDVTPVRVSHADQLNCYGYELRSTKEYMYYSGDANQIPQPILQKLLNNEYDCFFKIHLGLITREMCTCR